MNKMGDRKFKFLIFFFLLYTPHSSLVLGLRKINENERNGNVLPSINCSPYKYFQISFPYQVNCTPKHCLGLGV